MSASNARAFAELREWEHDVKGLSPGCIVLPITPSLRVAAQGPELRRMSHPSFSALTRRVSAICLAALVLSVVSCGEGNVECEIDAVFTDHQQSEIHRAANSWNAFSAREVRFASEGEGDWLILPASVTQNRLGYAQRKRRLIRINPVTPDDQIYAVALHELGHALGLGHVKRGVMDPDHQTIEFSPEDMAECRRAGACD